MDKVANYRDRASEIYRENRNIILILAFLNTALVTLFDILKADGFISSLLVIIVKLAVTAPLPMCTYHVYTRAIQGKTPEYYADNGNGVFPQSAQGSPFNAASIAVTGDPITNLFEDLAADATIL